MPPQPRKPAPMKGIVQPPWGTAPDLLKRGRGPKNNEPILIRIFTGYLIFRAATFWILALFLCGNSDNWIARFCTAHPQLFVRNLPFGVAGPNAELSIQSFLAGLCVFMAALYSFTAWKWLTRFWLARWGLMFISGATAFKTILGIALPGTLAFTTLSAPVGDPIPFTPLMLSVLVASSCINLAICLYLMFYPGVEQVFERPFQ